MKRTLFLAILLLCGVGSLRAQTASELVDRALTELGGAERLAALRSMEWSGILHQFDLVQSERPTGPWITNYTQVNGLRDLQHGTAARTEKTRGILFGSEWRESDFVVAEGYLFMSTPRGFFPYPPALASLTLYEQRLAPNRVMLEAARAEDLMLAGDTWLDDVRHHAVSFTSAGDSLVVFLNADTGLPTAVDTFRPAYFDIWGTARHRSYFGIWMLEDNGVRYPRQIDEYMDGIPSRSITIDDLAFDVPVPADTMAVPAEAVAMAATPSFDIRSSPYAQNRSGREPSTLPGGIVEVVGSWDVMFVPQSDGVVIIEAPISSEYSVKVLEDAAERFPDLPVKAVVTTSDAWPHFAGVREYAARGIPIYALDRNHGILTRLFDATFTQRPDALELNAATPDVHWVADDTILGEGENMMVLFPALGEGSERMLFVYFPAHGLLYASDMIQKMPDGSYFMPQYLSEVEAAAEREKLPVRNVIAMHTGLTPWSGIQAAIPR